MNAPHERWPLPVNLWTLPDPLPGAELFETLIEAPGLRVERIVSAGQVTPPGEWYDQEADEWVVLLQGEAELEYEGGTQQRLRAGDSVLLPAHCRHRVVYTSSRPACIWLAVHGRLTGGGGPSALLT
jgi:cupin 2 domain-containing protein